MNVFSVGASRNIGYYASLRLLESGNTVTFLLRSPACFDNDEVIQRHVKAGKAKLVKGDALNLEDVRKAWDAAGGVDVDLLLFTLGGTPSFSLTKGALLTPPNLCTQSLMNTLRAAPVQSPPKLKVAIISSTGLTKESHKNLPLTLRPMYAYLLRGPHDDKLGMERVLSHASSAEDWNNQKVSGNILPADGSWKTDLPTTVTTSTIVIRPAFLTDGKCKGVYRTSVGDHGSGFTTISRQDVAHFIAEDVVKNWSKWDNKIVSVAY